MSKNRYGEGKYDHLEPYFNKADKILGVIFSVFGINTSSIDEPAPTKSEPIKPASNAYQKAAEEAFQKSWAKKVEESRNSGRNIDSDDTASTSDSYVSRVSSSRTKVDAYSLCSA